MTIISELFCTKMSFIDVSYEELFTASGITWVDPFVLNKNFFDL